LGRGSVESRGLPIWNIPGSDSAWIFLDACVDWLSTILLAGAVLGGLLIVVSWALWRRVWWARRAVLGWCGLVVVAFALHALLGLRMMSAFASSEEAFLRRLAQALSSSLGPLQGLLLGPVLNSVIHNPTMLAMQTGLDSALWSVLIDYFVFVGWFPALAAIIFGRPAAKRYFATRSRMT
jgi:hypothetical protein